MLLAAMQGTDALRRGDRADQFRAQPAAVGDDSAPAETGARYGMRHSTQGTRDRSRANRSTGRCESQQHRRFHRRGAPRNPNDGMRRVRSGLFKMPTKLLRLSN